MKFIKKYFFCSERLLRNVPELKEIENCIKNILWKKEFNHKILSKEYSHQSAYNKAFEQEFLKYNWESQPILDKETGLKGDFQKNDVFIEIQFGHSASLYRDYYKFHYGLTKSLLWLAILIVPTNPKDFFPTRPKSVSNMAEFSRAVKYLTLLPIPVPIVLYGLEPMN